MRCRAGQRHTVLESATDATAIRLLLTALVLSPSQVTAALGYPASATPKAATQFMGVIEEWMPEKAGFG